MEELNGITLAYLGDAIYEVFVRDYLVNTLKIRHVNKLHKMCVNYTNAKAQATIIDYLMENNLLREEEILIYKRGRNSSASQAHKTCTVIEYKKATGFEALVCYLAENPDRLKYILLEGFKAIEVTWKK